MTFSGFRVASAASLAEVPSVLPSLTKMTSKSQGASRREERISSYKCSTFSSSSKTGTIIVTRGFFDITVNARCLEYLLYVFIGVSYTACQSEVLTSLKGVCHRAKPAEKANQNVHGASFEKH